MKTIHKIKSRRALTQICNRLRQEKKSIGFTSGVFDLFHAGHIEYLEKAKDLCDVLIVGVNSDVSVRRYKGANRPFVPEQQRAKVLAGLSSVDFVFIFNERRNQQNILSLKPDFYIKAGDYLPDQLTSKETVASVGGKVVLIPVESQISTSEIIRRIASAECAGNQTVVEKNGAVHFERKLSKAVPAVFLDRDGTINEEVEYLHEPEKFKLLPNVLKGLKKLQNMGYRLVIVTNQGAIGLGYYTKEDFYRVNRRMFQDFAPAGVNIDKIYFCPHNAAENCACRKPNTELIDRAVRDLNIDLSNSFIIGDKTSDLETGRRAGIRTILVKTGHAGKDGLFAVKADYTAEDLLDAAGWILQKERKSSS